MDYTTIVEIRGREVIDSRGNPTVEVDVTSKAAPSAAPRCPPAPPPAKTKPSNCATATRSAILGKGVLKAVENVNTKIAPALLGF
jgi:enolase